MAVAIVTRKEPLEHGDGVRLGAGAGLHHRNARGGVRREDAEQAVALPGAEGADVGCEVDDAAVAGLDRDDGRVHGRERYRPVVGRYASLDACASPELVKSDASPRTSMRSTRTMSRECSRASATMSRS